MQAMEISELTIKEALCACIEDENVQGLTADEKVEDIM